MTMQRVRGPSAVRNLSTMAITLVGILFLVPFLWLVVVAFQPHGSLELAGGGGFTLSNFTSLFSKGGMFLHSFENSLFLAVGTTVFTTVIAVLAAYPLSRFASRTQEYFVYVLVFLTGLPDHRDHDPDLRLFRDAEPH